MVIDSIEMLGGSRLGGIPRRIAMRVTTTVLQVLPVWLVATVSATLWTSWTMSTGYAHGHPGNLNDFTWAILNAGAQSRAGGIGHLYSGSGSILVALPGFQLFLVFLVRVLGWIGANPPADQLVLVHRGAGYAAIGIVWPAMAAVAYALAFASVIPLLALARRCGLAGWRRAVFLMAATGALWWMSAIWGHPDDAVAIGLLALATDRFLKNHERGAAWLMGVAFAVQPLVLLATPLLLALRPARRWLALLIRIAVPGLVAVAIPFIGDPIDTWRQVVEQPTYPRVGHPTPWLAVVPHPSLGVVYAGWPRSVGVGLACLVALGLARHVKTRGSVDPLLLVWMMAACLVLRCVFESVIFPYYVVPPILFALLASAVRSGGNLAVCVAASSAAAYVSTFRMGDHLLYWVLVLVCLIVATAAGLPKRTITAGLGPDKIAYLQDRPASTQNENVLASS